MYRDSMPARWAAWAALAVALGAFALQLYRLDVQSFAFDEGWTSYAIHHSWADLLPVLAPDNHPPLYYVAVKAWTALAGDGDWAVRFFSVACGTALTAALYALGRRLAGPVAGLAAALLAACSPLFVYYAQEARMYSLLMLLGVLSTLALVRLAHDPADRRRWIAYVVLACLALYTHYFAALLIVTHNVAALGWIVANRQVPLFGNRQVPLFGNRQVPLFGNRQARLLGRWLLGQLAVFLLYLPWLPVVVRQVSVGQGTWWRMPLPARLILRDMWRFAILGPRRPAGVPIWGSMLGPLALALLVALLLGWRRGRGGWVFSLLILVLPAAAVAFLGSRLPLYTDRYALIVVPGVPLLAGIGVAACWSALPGRRAGWGRAAALVLLAAAAAGPLPHLYAYYHQPDFWREDFRRAAQYVMDTTGEGDAVVMVGSYQPMMQYYRGPAAVVRFPQQRDSVQSEDEVIAALNQAIGPHSQVRLVMYSWPTVDPQGLVEGALRAQCRLQGEHWQLETGQRPIRVLNLEGCASFQPEPRRPIAALWDDQIALSAYRLIHAAPGEQAHLFLWWQAVRRPDRDYSVFVHLIGADGQIITQFDHLPLSDFYPMRAWPLGVELRDDNPLNIPAGVDLTSAWLAVGLYDRSTEMRLSVVVDGTPAGDMVRIPLE